MTVTCRSEVDRMLKVIMPAERSRRREVHDYRTQRPGHQVIRGDDPLLAYVTGRDLHEGDVILLPEGEYVAEIVMPHEDSDLFLVEMTGPT